MDFLGIGRFAPEATLSGDDVKHKKLVSMDYPSVEEYVDRLRKHVPGLPLAGANTGLQPVAAPTSVWSARGDPSAIAI